MCDIQHLKSEDRIMAFQEKGRKEFRELGSTASPSKKAGRDVPPSGHH
jgi:hypothetical protein